MAIKPTPCLSPAVPAGLWAQYLLQASDGRFLPMASARPICRGAKPFTPAFPDTASNRPAWAQSLQASCPLWLGGALPWESEL